METTIKNDYDVVVIGAGISGLVCGCYLAKAGFKTLIVEKNAKPGGYCMSFRRKGYFFDACVHSLSSFRKGGILDRLVSDLEIKEKLTLNRHNPSDLIITPDYEIKIYNDFKETIFEFQKKFPKEKSSIESFFEFINSGIFTEIRSKTFYQVINFYFDDKILKSIISSITFQLLGFSVAELSAMDACLLWREFILDGGYYPEKGIQSFSNILAARFTELRGEIIYSKLVKKIFIEKNFAKGIYLDDGQFISSRFVISACDLRQTYFDLVGGEKIDLIKKEELDRIIPSLSAFLVYTAINCDNNDNFSKFKSNIWLIDEYINPEDETSKISKKIDSIVIVSPWAKSEFIKKNKKISVSLATAMPFVNHAYWDERQINDTSDKILKIANNAFPNLFEKIDFKFFASPNTLYKWTLNNQGAAYGLSGISSQFGNPSYSQNSKIRHLFFTGHWTNLGSGIASVVNCGKFCSKLLNKKT